jgi:hypothetical protein
VPWDDVAQALSEIGYTGLVVVVYRKGQEHCTGCRNLAAPRSKPGRFGARWVEVLANPF